MSRVAPAHKRSALARLQPSRCQADPDWHPGGGRLRAEVGRPPIREPTGRPHRSSGRPRLTGEPGTWHEIEVPTLVVHGRRDPFFPVGNGEAIAREIPGARLLVLEEAATAIPDAAASEVAVAMLALA